MSLFDVNQVTLLGRVGQDPEVRTTNGGTTVCSLSVATGYKAKDREPETEWHRVVCFGWTAEAVGERLRKGDKVFVQGRLQTRQWEDRDGNRRSTTEIVADRCFGTSAPGGVDSNRGQDRSRSGGYDQGSGYTHETDDDRIPF